MIVSNERQVTEAVQRALEDIEDSRQREILQALVKHLHAFVRDVGLTETEFREATELVNGIGQATTDSHNEAVLVAGSLGVSQLVCLLNNQLLHSTQDNSTQTAMVTTQSVLGPFWRKGSPAMANGESLLRCDTPGTPLFVELVIHDHEGVAVNNAKVDICLLYTSPSPRDATLSRMPSSA